MSLGLDVQNIIHNMYYFEVIGVIGFLAFFGTLTGYLSSNHHIPFGGKKSKNQSHVYVSMSSTS